MAKRRRLSRWVNNTRVNAGHGWEAVPKGALRHEGRVFEISELWALNFSKPMEMPKFYEVCEFAVLDHRVHRRTLGQFRTRERALAWIAAEGPLDRESEAREARAERIRWFEDERHPQLTGICERLEKEANRKTRTNSDGARIAKSAEVIESQRARLMKVRATARSERADYTRMVRLQKKS